MKRLSDLKYDIKYAWQRATKGYDDRAVWDTRHWFLENTTKILTEMNNNRSGYPHGMTDASWNKTLNKMIECFTEANEDTCTKKNKYQLAYDKMWEEFTEEFGLLGDKLPQPEECIKEGTIRMFTPSDKEVKRKDWKKITDDFLREDDKIIQYRHKKLEEGLDLFKEYFWSLWD